MKLSKLNLITCSLLLIASTSCGVFNKTQKKPQVTSETPVKTTQPANSTTATTTSDENLAGEWTAYTIAGQKVDGENRPYINFSMEDHRVYGSNGCNIVNGDFKTGTDGSMTITNVLSTMMACPDAKFEQTFNKALDDVRYYSISKKGHEYFLDMKNSQKLTVMVLRKHNMDFLNGTWNVIEISGKKYNNPDMEMVIDIQEQRLHGNTGCNIVNGALTIDPDKSNSIQFMDLASTRMMCPEENMKAETAMLVALESVEYAQKGKNNTVIMSDKDNQPILILKKVEVER